MGSRTKGDTVLIEFDYTLDFDNIDYRKNPELYIIGRGEQGVLLLNHTNLKSVNTGDSARQKSRSTSGKSNLFYV